MQSIRIFLAILIFSNVTPLYPFTDTINSYANHVWQAAKNNQDVISVGLISGLSLTSFFFWLQKNDLAQKFQKLLILQAPTSNFEKEKELLAKAKEQELLPKSNELKDTFEKVLKEHVNTLFSEKKYPCGHYIKRLSEAINTLGIVLEQGQTPFATKFDEKRMVHLKETLSVLTQLLSYVKVSRLRASELVTKETRRKHLQELYEKEEIKQNQLSPVASSPKKPKKSKTVTYAIPDFTGAAFTAQIAKTQKWLPSYTYKTKQSTKPQNRNTAGTFTSNQLYGAPKPKPVVSATYTVGETTFMRNPLYTLPPSKVSSQKVD